MIHLLRNVFSQKPDLIIDYSMNAKLLPTEDQMLGLKRELNFLLWTSDAPKVPEHFPLAVVSKTTPEIGKINMNCVAHVVVAAAIFIRRGFSVTTGRGIAWVLDTSPDGNRHKDWLNQIANHCWLTLDDHGLVDLSLNAETEHPLVYCNQSPGSRWRIAFVENQAELNVFLSPPQRGCFYLTLTKRCVTSEELVLDLAQNCLPAKACGMLLPFSKIVDHAERLLTGKVESLMTRSQKAAWQELAVSPASSTG
jgi:hypothetical protein